MNKEGKYSVTQLTMIKNHLLTYGRITSWEAIERYRVTRLSQYIYLLRKEGYHFDVERKKNTNNQGWHSVYILKDEEE